MVTAPLPGPWSVPLPLAMPEVDPSMGVDNKEAKSRLEDIKYYTRDTVNPI